MLLVIKKTLDVNYRPNGVDVVCFSVFRQGDHNDLYDQMMRHCSEHSSRQPKKTLVRIVAELIKHSLCIRREFTRKKRSINKRLAEITVKPVKTGGSRHCSNKCRGSMVNAGYLQHRRTNGPIF